MILNKKQNLLKASKAKNNKENKDKIKNKKENIYLHNILKTNSKESLNPQIKSINENMQDIFSSDESKKKALKFILRKHKKDRNININQHQSFKTINNNNNSMQIALTEPEMNTINYKDSSDLNKDKIINQKLTNIRNQLYKNISEKIIITNNDDNNNKNNNNNNNKVEYAKIEYNNDNNNNNDVKNNINNDEDGYKTPVNNDRRNFSNDEEEKDIPSDNNNNQKEYEVFPKNFSNYNNMYNSMNYQLHNKKENNILDIGNVNTTNSINNDYIIDHNYYKIRRKIKVPKLIKDKKKSLTLIGTKLKNRTVNSFYIQKKPATVSANEERNHQLNRENQTNILSDYNDTHIITYQDNIENLYDYNNKTLDTNNKRNALKNYFNRKKNKIRIIDNGRSIKEFNISFPEEENDYIFEKKNKNNRLNYQTINNVHTNNNQIHVEDNNNYYLKKDKPSININQFITNARSNNNNSKQKNNKENNYRKNNSGKFISEYLTERYNNKKKYNNRNFVSNEIFNNNLKIHTTIEKSNLINNNNDNGNNKINTIGKNNTFKVLIKKRPINDMRVKNFSYKKFQNLKYVQDKDKRNKKNNFSKNKENNENEEINKPNDKNALLSHNYIQSEESIEIDKKDIEPNNTKYDFCPGIRLGILIKPKKDITNIDKKIENINKNIIIIKKDKGKIINQIYIDEDIEKINQQLLNEKFTINKLLVKLIPINDNNNLENNDIDKNNIVYEENEKLKNENELLKKKDIINSEMIQKLDKEKENLIQEINKLIKENNEQKNINEKILKENEKIKEENIKINNSLNEILKADKGEEEIFELGNINFNVDIESINDGATEKMEEIKDIINKSDREKDKN